MLLLGGEVIFAVSTEAIVQHPLGRRSAASAAAVAAERLVVRWLCIDTALHCSCKNNASFRLLLGWSQWFTILQICIFLSMFYLIYFYYKRRRWYVCLLIMTWNTREPMTLLCNSIYVCYCGKWLWEQRGYSWQQIDNHRPDRRTMDEFEQNKKMQPPCPLLSSDERIWENISS